VCYQRHGLIPTRDCSQHGARAHNGDLLATDLLATNLPEIR
jgi:hypothetical protein